MALMTGDRGEKSSQKRPKNLDLLMLALKLPVVSMVSLLHRASGAILFLMLPLAIAWLDRTLYDESAFNDMVSLLEQPVLKMVMWVGIWAFFYHLCAGIRFLFLDVHWGIDAPKPRLTAWITIVISSLLTVFVGVLLW